LPNSTLNDWLSWLETLSPREIVLGLDRVQEMLVRLKISRPQHVLHIAGTNGKGSSAAMLEAILKDAGERVGCFTSPHLRRYNERIRVNGVDCGDDEIVAVFSDIESVRRELPLTYFEFGTLAAMLMFQRHAVTAAVLEVGMGGRLDAVNAVEPDGGIITNVSLDHCAWLGDDVQAIAVEKAGIMRRNKPLVFGSRDVPTKIIDCAEQTGADLRLAGKDYDYVLKPDDIWDWRGKRVSLSNLPRPALEASVQVQNAAAVLALLEALEKPTWLDRDTVARALSRLSLPGRMQRIRCGRQWLLDVAHNAAAATALADSLPSRERQERVVAIISALADKDLAAIVRPLCASVDEWIAVAVDGPRAIAAEEIARDVANACGSPCLVAGSVREAITLAETRTGELDQILVVGSFYVVGPALDELYSRREAI
jgi:dihydrofolate synthase/folylpolyglutamate synthase